MPINPFRSPSNYDVPNFPAPAGRLDPSVFSNLAGIGESIGAYRDQQALADLAKGAIGPNGQLDTDKFFTAIALSGRDPTRLLNSLTAQKAVAETAGYHKTQAGLDQQRIDALKEANKQGRSQIFSKPNPLGIGPDTFYRYDPDTNAIIEMPPTKAAPTPAPVVAPQSSVAPPPDNFAQRYDAFENAPPYQVAQAAGAVPTPSGAVAPGGKPGRNEAYLQTFPEGGREQLKAVVDYQEPLPAQGRAAWLDAARKYDPTFDPSQYELKKREALRPERQFSPEEITKLTEAGGKALDASRFASTFKPEFSGPQFAKGALMTAGKVLPKEYAERINPSLPAAVEWWNGYESFKNDVRKGTFGATLTKNELEAFNNANITPTTDPELAQRLLARQQLIVTNALRRQTGALISEGYNPQTISQAYGMDLKKELGVTAEGRTRGALSGSQPLPKVQNDAEASMRIQQARDAYKNGLPRDQTLKMMRDMGIPNPELHLGN